MLKGWSMMKRKHKDELTDGGSPKKGKYEKDKSKSDLDRKKLMKAKNMKKWKKDVNTDNDANVRHFVKHTKITKHGQKNSEQQDRSEESNISSSSKISKGGWWEKRRDQRKKIKLKKRDKKISARDCDGKDLKKAVVLEDRDVKERKKTILPESVSCNWKKLQLDENMKERKRRVKKNAKSRKSDEGPPAVQPTQSPALDIWFDDVDEELLNICPKPPAPVKSPPTSRKKQQPSDAPGDSLVKDNAFKGLTKAVALDCEMVGVGEEGKESILARVSVVNQHGECLYDKFVRPREEVVDYRTQWSGVTPEHLEQAEDFLDVQKAVSDLLKGRILVGHALQNDLKVLFLDHPRKAIRDTSQYKPYRALFKGRTPSLKNLTSKLLSVKIQSGEHDSVTDAQAAMRLYTLNRQEWESHMRSKKIKRMKTAKKKDGVKLKSL